MDYGAGLRNRLTPSRVAARGVIELRKLAAPILIRRSPLYGRTFESFGGRELPYWLHRHNLTWRNERSVEIPIAVDFLAAHGHGRGLEVGNVLGRYGLRRDWQVVDRYEVGPDIINVDIVDYAPAESFDFIVSISTLEHVGWDETPREPDKVERAFHRLRSLLAPGGVMLVTAPLGYHPRLDEMLTTGALTPDEEMTLVRDRDVWRRIPGVEARPLDNGNRTGARSVWVGIVRAPAPIAPESGEL